MISLERDGDVFLLDLGDGDNRFNAESIDGINAALDDVERADGPAALVTKASGRIWSNGLDLDYMATLDDVVSFVADVQRIMARLLELPMPTVAAIQGHAFAGGTMLALSHDVRVMRVDRGYLCLPEIDLGMPFGKGFAGLIGAKQSRRLPSLHLTMLISLAAVSIGLGALWTTQAVLTGSLVNMLVRFAVSVGLGLYYLALHTFVRGHFR